MYVLCKVGKGGGRQSRRRQQHRHQQQQQRQHGQPRLLLPRGVLGTYGPRPTLHREEGRPKIRAFGPPPARVKQDFVVHGVNDEHAFAAVVVVVDVLRHGVVGGGGGNLMMMLSVVVVVRSALLSTQDGNDIDEDVKDILSVNVCCL